MASQIDFGTMAAAREVRDEFSHALARGDDRRTKTVNLLEDELEDHELEEIVGAAEASRATRGEGGPGQVALTKAERDRLDFSKGRANIFHARSVKAVMLDEGVSDWVAHYDPTLSVDEHRTIAKDALADTRGGTRRDADELEIGDSLERARGEACDHARGHCKHGDPEACEFLGEVCGFSEEEIAALMAEDGADRPLDELAEFTGPQLGALRRSWRGYYGAIDAIEQNVRHARDSFAAINSIRAEAGQEPLEPRRLEELGETIDAILEEPITLQTTL